MPGGDRRKVISWCVLCHHAIVPAEDGGWGHCSNDDWAGPDSECTCAWSLVPCRPPRRTLRRGRIQGYSPPMIVYDEVKDFGKGAP